MVKRMSTLKQASLWALITYVVLMPLSLMLPAKPELGPVTVSADATGHDVYGEVHYSHGEVRILSYHGHPLVDVANFRWRCGKTYSTTELLSGVVSGRIPHGESHLRVDWIAVLLAFPPVWLGVGLMYLIVHQIRVTRATRKTPNMTQ